MSQTDKTILTIEEIEQQLTPYLDGLKRCNVSLDIVNRNRAVLQDFINHLSYQERVG